MEIKNLRDLGWAIYNYRRTKSEETRIQNFVHNNFPSGSGIDTGCTLDLDKSTPYQLVVWFSWHHMDEHGFYVGWTSHTAIIRPSFMGHQYQFYSPDYTMQYDHDQQIIKNVYEILGDDIEWDDIDWDALSSQTDIDYWNLPEYEEFCDELQCRFEFAFEQLD